MKRTRMTRVSGRQSPYDNPMLGCARDTPLDPSGGKYKTRSYQGYMYYSLA